MATSIAQKLRIKEGMRLRTLHAPEDFESRLQPLPAGVSITTSGKQNDQVHWFVTDRAALETEVEQVMDLVSGEVICWVYYPKGTSRIKTDLTRDKGWDKLQQYEDLQWLSLVSFDETWSVFAFRRKTAADRKKEEKTQVREIFDYIDPVGKTVRLPDDLSEALRQQPQAEAFFNTLSFSNRKEYVEWIITAKREATRRERITGTIERLQQGWKNPRNT